MLDTIIYSNTLPTEGITAGLVGPFWLVSVFYRERRHGHNILEPLRYSETQRTDGDVRPAGATERRVDDTEGRCHAAPTDWEFQKLR